MTTTTKRIPKGTRVRWRARYPSDPLNEGEVVEFLPAWDLSSRQRRHSGCPFAVYVVKVDRTTTGKPRKTPKFMRPYASRLEAQNPEALEG